VDEPSYTSRRNLLNLIIGTIPAATIGLSLVASRPASSQDLTPPETAEVSAILDGDTVKLADGDVLRLSGIEAAKPDLAPGNKALAALAEAAKANLKARIGTGPILLRQDAGKRDRYGRRLARAFNSSGTWLQESLVSAGLARVRGDARNRLGLETLLKVEAGARDAGLGIWRHPLFAVRAAEDPALERLSGTFQIVSGRVFAAAVVKNTGFINFGVDRKTDLTLVLKKPALDLGGPAMMNLGWLTAEPIRCRGWLDLYDGPRIDVSYPEQIEVLAG